MKIIKVRLNIASKIYKATKSENEVKYEFDIKKLVYKDRLSNTLIEIFKFSKEYMDSPKIKLVKVNL